MTSPNKKSATRAAVLATATGFRLTEVDSESSGVAFTFAEPSGPAWVKAMTGYVPAVDDPTAPLTADERVALVKEQSEWSFNADVLLFADMFRNEQGEREFNEDDTKPGGELHKSFGPQHSKLLKQALRNLGYLTAAPDTEVEDGEEPPLSPVKAEAEEK